MRYLLLFLLALAGCGPMLYGGNGPPPKASQFRLTVWNDDATVETASVCWWSASAIVGSRDVVVQPGSSGTFDLGTVKPDGLQVVMGTARAFAGILQGPGGLVLQSTDYLDWWNPEARYPSGTVTMK